MKKAILILLVMFGISLATNAQTQVELGQYLSFTWNQNFQGFGGQQIVELTTVAYHQNPEAGMHMIIPISWWTGNEIGTGWIDARGASTADIINAILIEFFPGAPL